MSTTGQASVPPTPLAPPRLRPMRLDDYPCVQELERTLLPSALPADDWRGLFLDNPLWPRLSDRWPIGWVLEDESGKVVGSMANVPSLYRFGDRELICANGRAWAVLPEHRGFALWLMDEYFNQPGADLFVNTTVGTLAEEAIATLSKRVPLGDWQSTALLVTGYRAVVREALEIKRVPLAGVLALPAAAVLRLRDTVLGRRLPAPPAEVVVEGCDGFDARFDLFWNELLRQNSNKLLAVRDARTLSWHFAIPLRRKHLWTLTASRNGLLRAYCVLKRQDTQHGLRRLRLVDYQTVDAEDLLPELLRAALRLCAEQGFSAIEQLGCGLPNRRAFDELAAHRRRLSSWMYYAHATDPALDAELRAPAVWDPSEYDGDASLA